MVLNIAYTPGSIISHRQTNQRYLVVSIPMLLRSLQKVVKVIPINKDMNCQECSKQDHLPIPTYLQTKGILCLHKEDKINCQDINFVERLNDKLTNYVLDQI